MGVKKKASRVAEVRRGSAGGEETSNSEELELQETEDVVRKIVRALRTQRPFGEEDGAEAGADYLAASLVAYASEKHPRTSAQWCEVLAEVLTDAGSTLDDDDNEGAVRSVIRELVKRSVLAPAVAQIEEGSAVLAVLAEDGEWHEAVVQQVLGPSNFMVMFLQYGKPQETQAASICLMEAIADDEGADELQEGTCEMCARHRLLTFHHLIPKDVHPTYLKKRLPPGIEGEPTRHFLNTYGTMICRQCHGFVHRLAPNDVLAKEYNTLPKILAHPSSQNWVKWIGQQTSGR